MATGAKDMLRREFVYLASSLNALKFIIRVLLRINRFTTGTLQKTIAKYVLYLVWVLSLAFVSDADTFST